LDYISNDKDLFEMESQYQISATGMRAILYHGMSIYVELLEAMMGIHRWPNVAEQNRLIGLLPRSLQHLRFFYLVDSFEVANVDSTDEDTRRQHFQYPKGFGMQCLIFTDILGKMLHLTVDFDGNSGDSSMYHSSAPYLQQNGIVTPINTTGLGDSTFEGFSSSISAGARPLLSTAPYGGMVGAAQNDLARMLHAQKKRVRQGKCGRKCHQNRQERIRLEHQKEKIVVNAAKIERDLRSLCQMCLSPSTRLAINAWASLNVKPCSSKPNWTWWKS
jgi:hypothetical protein